MQVQCAFCDGLLEAAAEDLGQRISCPHCTLDFELSAASIAEEQVASGSNIGSWVNGSLSTVVSTAIHTVMLVLCALWVYPQQVNEPVGVEVELAELPVQQTLTNSAEPEQLEMDSSEVTATSDDISEIEVEVVETTEAAGGSNDLSDAIEALATSSVSGSKGAILSRHQTSFRSGNVAKSGNEDAFSSRPSKGGKTVNRGRFTVASPPEPEVQKRVLAMLGVCGYGYGWKKVPGGYMCQANVCWISDAQFDALYRRMYPGRR